jgi:hypothetical protein
MEKNIYDTSLFQVVSFKANNLYEYLDLVRKRIELYVGEKSITGLDCHIYGYINACRVKEIEETLNPPFHKFHLFVADYYSYQVTPKGWRQIILFENNNNEEKSIEVFWQLFDLFRKDEKYLLKTA